MMQNVKKIRSSSSDRRLYTGITVVLVLVGIIMLYPILYIVACSFSTPESVMAGDVILFPVEFSLVGYRAVFRNSKILLGFRNSIFYTILATVIGVSMTVIAAYPLSRKDLPGRGILMKLFTFTMIFGGGMIPNYLLIKELGMLNSFWAVIIPGAMGVYNMIVARTYFMNSIPGELLEAAQIDGCGDIKYMLTILVPLSKPILAVVAMREAVSQWNAYFNAFLYLSDQKLMPLQVFLREILVSSQISADMMVEEAGQEVVFGAEYILKYALIVVATVPILMIYPLVQKHFVKGMMVGSVKG